MTKVLYLTLPSFFDLEISLIRELSKFVDVRPVILVSRNNNHLTAFDMNDVGDKTGLVGFSEFPELAKYSELIDMNRWLIAVNSDDSLKGNVILVRQIIKYIRKNSIDIIHTVSDCRLMLMLLPYVAFFKHKILTIHDPVPHSEGNRFIDYFVKRYCNYNVYHNVMLLSHSLEHEVVSRYCTGSIFKPKIFFSRLGVYDYLKSYPIKENEYGPYILFHGRIAYYKGVDILIDSYLSSTAVERGIKLVIAGAGVIENENKDNPNIIVLNQYIGNEDLASLISNCLFTVLPYRTATQSGVLMASFAFCKPALVTRTGDLPHTVTDGVLGHVVEPGNAEALRLGIDKMLDSDLNGMSSNISAEYHNGGTNSWTAIADDLAEIYERL